MLIKDVRAYSVFANFRNWCFIKIVTDEGIYGIGEATVEFQTNAVMGCIQDLKPLFVEQDPRDIYGLIYRAQRYAYYQDNPILQSALAGYEVALWDILGKALNTPVWQLLGGRLRDSIAIYGNAWRQNAVLPEEFAKVARAAVDNGCRALKWDPFGCSDRSLTTEELLAAEEQIAAVREAVGSEVQLLIEGHGRFSVTGALEVLHMLEPYDPYYFEEPVISSDLSGLAEVRRNSKIRIAAGERVHTVQGFRELFTRGAVDVAQPDLIHVGGIRNIRKIAALAEGFGVSVTLHNCNGPIGNAATLHADAGICNLDLQETMLMDAPWRQIISTEKMEVKDGYLLPVPDAPGLGVDLVEEKLKDYPPRFIPDFMFAPHFYEDKSIRRAGTVSKNEKSRK